jgi:hypothetical protein
MLAVGETLVVGETIGGRRMRVSICILTWLFIVVPCQARVIYVDVNTPDHNDGSSWAKAYRYLQDALGDANKGIYTPDTNSADPNGSGDREDTFQLVNGVALKGGYAGVGEVDPSDRDYELYETVLSGDLDGNDVGWQNYGENSYHVVTGSNTDATAIIDGFTVYGGNAYGPNPHWYAGGIYIIEGSPSVNNCTFTKNTGKYAGAWYNIGGNLVANSCKFINNYAGYYGGAWNTWMGNITLINCIFIDNYSSVYGGGMAVYRSNASLSNCTFIGNGRTNVVGGAIGSTSNNMTIRNCTFVENIARNGKGISCNSGYPETTNLYISNSIFWNPIDEEAEISQLNDDEDFEVTVHHSNIRNGIDGVDIGPAILNWLEGNTDIDPLFADPNNNDYHLQSQAGRYDPDTQTWIKDANTSPCIDAGDPTSPISLEPFPNGGRINMGAYGGTTEASKSYFGEPICETIVAGDINGDCIVDWKDFAIMGLHWLEDNRE